MSQLVESREELDESERDPGHRVSDRVGESASVLGDSGLDEKKTLILGVVPYLKNITSLPQPLYSPLRSRNPKS